MTRRPHAGRAGKSFPIVLLFVAGSALPVMHPSGADVLYAQAPPQDSKC